MGENPAVGSANAKLQRLGMAKLDWLVVRDFRVIETRDLLEGRAGDRDRRAAHRGHRDRGVLPARRRAHREGRAPSPTPSACCSGTTRRSSRRATAAASCGSSTTSAAASARSSRGSDGPARPAAPRPDLGLPDRGPARRARAPRPCCARSTAATPTASRVAATPSSRPTARPPAAAGSTRGVLRGRRQPGRPPQAGRRAELGRARVGLGLAAQPPHPLQPRLGRPRRQAVERAQGATSGGTPDEGDWTGARRARLRGRPSRPTTCRPTGATARTRCAATTPFIMQADGKGWLYAPSGPGRRAAARRTTSRRSRRSATCSTAQQRNPTRQVLRARRQPLQPDRRRAGADVYPYVAHDLPAHRAPHRRRHEPLAALPGRAAAGDVRARSRPSWPRERGLEHGGWATIVTRAAAIEARVLVTERMTPLRVEGRACTRSACRTTGDRTGSRPATPPTSCSPLVLDPNVHIQEIKAATCDIRPGRRPRGPALLELVEGYRRPAPRDGAADAALKRCRGRDVAATRRTTARWASSPTRRSASAARPARWPARSGTRSPRTGSTSPACRYDNTGGAGRRHLAPRRLHRAAQRRSRGHVDAASTPARLGRLPLADVLRRLQALHPRRLPRRLPDRRAVPHRVRHGRRAGGHLQRLRLLRPRLPVRRASTSARTTAGPGSARSATTGSSDGLEPACAKACPTDSIQFGAARRAARARGDARVDELHERGGRRGPALRRRPRRRRRRRRRVLPAARRAGGLRPAARPGRHRRATCRRDVAAAAGAAAARSRPASRRRVRRGARGEASRDGAAAAAPSRRSYYGRPILKPPVWTWTSPATSSSAAWPAASRARGGRAAHRHARARPRALARSALAGRRRLAPRC